MDQIDWRDPQMGSRRVVQIISVKLGTVALSSGRVLVDFDIEDPANPVYLLVQVVYQRHKHCQAAVNFLLHQSSYIPLWYDQGTCGALVIPSARRHDESRLTIPDIQFIETKLPKYISRAVRRYGL